MGSAAKRRKEMNFSAPTAALAVHPEIPADTGLPLARRAAPMMVSLFSVSYQEILRKDFSWAPAHTSAESEH